MISSRFSLSSSTLKIVAVVLMTIDHVGLLFFPEDPTWRMIGRLSFPLFALLIAEGYRRTSNAPSYARRLFLFALISQIPYALVIYASGVQKVTLNIFFTLFAGLVALVALRRLPTFYSLPFILCILFLVELLHFDYGMYGVLTILASYVFLNERKLGSVLLFILPFAYTLAQAWLGVFSIQFLAIFSIPIVLAYNGNRGKTLPRYFFYAFYPAHIVVLWCIWIFAF